MRDERGFSRIQGTPACVKAFKILITARMILFPFSKEARSLAEKRERSAKPHGWCLVRMMQVRSRATVKEVHGAAIIAASYR